MFKIYSGATEFKQWELDQMVVNDCMEVGDEVVFRNSNGETYVAVAFAQDGKILADVPNYLLKTAGNILVDMEQGADSRPACRTTFAVVAQDKPDGYECKYNIPDRHTKSGGVSSWNDLTDKPFGTETTMKEVFPTQMVSEYRESDLGGYTAAFEGVGAVLEVGKAYRVTVDGVVFEGDGLADWGDFVYFPIDDSMSLSYQPSDDRLVVSTSNTNPRQLCIETVSENVTKIDPKYLPSVGGGGIFYVTFMIDYDEESCTADKTYDEILEAYNSGKTICGRAVEDYGENNTHVNLINMKAISHGADNPFNRYAEFISAYYEPDGFGIDHIVVRSTGAVEYMYYEYGS